MGHASRLLWIKKHCPRDFQRWNKAGIMAEIFRILLAEYGEKVGVDAQWQAMDGTLLQAPTRSQKISD